MRTGLLSLLPMLMVAACDGTSWFSGGAIRVDHQAFVRGYGAANAVAQLPGGGLVVAGTKGSALAIATDPAGHVLWTYQIPFDPQVRSQYQSEFDGVVPLANGNILLCGSKALPSDDSSVSRTALVTILDANGALVEERLLYPNDDKSYFDGNFRQCYAWDGGIALVGGAQTSSASGRWIVKLDSHARKQWESFLPRGAPVSASDPGGPGIVYGIPDSQPLQLAGVELSRVGRDGAIVAKRTIKGYAFFVLRDTTDSAGTKLIVWQLGAKHLLYSLNERLEDAATPTEVCGFNLAQGIGYVLADRSLALFGNEGNAAVAWESARSSRCSVRELSDGYRSDTVTNAIPIADNQFVAVQYSDGPTPDTNGLLMSWVTFRR